MNMPNQNTIMFNELLDGLNHTTIHIGPISTSLNAYTQWNSNGTAADIYIDPSKLGTYQNAFGTAMGVDYVVYHELAHAMPDGFTDRNLSNAEAIANSYGQGLAMLSGAAYPNSTQLQLVGGGAP